MTNDIQCDHFYTLNSVGLHSRYKELILTMGYAGQGDTLPTYDKMYGLL